MATASYISGNDNTQVFVPGVNLIFCANVALNPVVMTEQATVCPMCTNIIVDANKTFEEEEALFREGACKKWLHHC